MKRERKATKIERLTQFIDFQSSITKLRTPSNHKMKKKLQKKKNTMNSSLLSNKYINSILSPTQTLTLFICTIFEIETKTKQ